MGRVQRLHVESPLHALWCELHSCACLPRDSAPPYRWDSYKAAPSSAWGSLFRRVHACTSPLFLLLANEMGDIKVLAKYQPHGKYSMHSTDYFWTTVSKIIFLVAIFNTFRLPFYGFVTCQWLSMISGDSFLTHGCRSLGRNGNPRSCIDPAVKMMGIRSFALRFSIPLFWEPVMSEAAALYINKGF